MEKQPPIIFKNLKSHIAEAIKGSCYVTDARFYNIANQVASLPTYTPEPGVEIAKGLSQVIEKAIKEAIAVGCDLSVIVQGILLGAFRANPSIAHEAHKTIRILITEVTTFVYRYKGDVKQAVEGVVAGMMAISNEFKLNEEEALLIAREEMLIAANGLDPQFANKINEIFSKQT